MAAVLKPGSFVMRLGKVLVFSGCLFLAACAGQKPAPTASAPVEYVEIPNPAMTMSPDQPATIWVPRSYVESGVPRGGDLVKKGVEKVFPSTVDQQKVPQAPVASRPLSSPAVPAATAAAYSAPQKAALPAYQQQSAGGHAPSAMTGALRHRVVIIEIGQNGLTQTLQEQLGKTGVVLMADPAQANFLAQSATLSTPEGKSSFAQRLQQEYNVNEVLFLGTSGLAPGKTVSAEVYDTMGGGLLRGFEAAIPSYKDSDQAARDTAVAEALSALTAKVRDLVPLLPWYSRISAVNGNTAYVPVGKEGGLRIGQTLKVYHGGKFLKGLGFAPGSKIGLLEVDGFVGPNGAFCAIRDGQGIEAADVVSAE